MRRWALPVVKTTTQRGFSLIELMIVLVIIGVLAAVAIPNYQGYVARAKVTKLIQFISPYQQRYSDYYLGNGNAAPADTAALQQRIFGGATAFSDVGIAAVVQDSAKTGFVVTVSSSYVGTDKNGYLKFSLADKDGALIWSCSAVTDANGATKSTIGDFIGMLPDNCR